MYEFFAGDYDVAVIGAGAAGLAAAAECARSGLAALAIAREELAGGILRQKVAVIFRSDQQHAPPRRNRILQLAEAEPAHSGERILPDDHVVAAPLHAVPGVVAGHALMAAVDEHRMQPDRPLRIERSVGFMEGRKFRIHAQIYLLFWDIFLQCTIFKLTFQTKVFLKLVR